MKCVVGRCNSQGQKPSDCFLLPFLHPFQLRVPHMIFPYTLSACIELLLPQNPGSHSLMHLMSVSRLGGALDHNVVFVGCRPRSGKRLHDGD